MTPTKENAGLTLARRPAALQSTESRDSSASRVEQTAWARIPLEAPSYVSELAGEATAKAMMATVATAPPDRLYVEVAHLVNLGDAARLRAFLRVVQKALEGSA